MKTPPQTFSHSSSAGYTMVELLVAMVLGLFLMSGFFTLNQSNQKTSRLQEAVAQTQKNGRFVIDYVSNAVKTAGYSGFYEDFSTGVENVLNNANDLEFDLSQPVVGFNNLSPNDTIAGITGFVQGSDALLLKKMSHKTAAVVSNTASDTVIVGDTSAFSIGDVVVISDLDQASIFQINNASVSGSNMTLTLNTEAATPGNQKVLLNKYDKQAEVGKLESQLFYIKNGQNGKPALYTTMLANNSGSVALKEVELTSNIDNLQFVYSVDTDGDAVVDSKLTASAVSDWNQVVGVSMALLVKSDNENVVPIKSSFSYDSQLVSFKKDTDELDEGMMAMARSVVVSEDVVPENLPDRTLKRSFTSYIGFRNRPL